MVYAFFIGLFVGLPIGCYLREVGYASKIQRAYQVLSPPQDSQKFDKLKSKSCQFYDDLKKGQVENKDFERYIYGGQHIKKNPDERDRIEENLRDSIKDFKQ